MDVLVVGQKIERVAKNIDCSPDKIIDAQGCWVMPGLIDLHTHLREPGFEYKEDILTGTRAAVAGGFTAVCCMPNTKPVIDSTAAIQKIISQQAYCLVLPVGSITKNQEGRELSPMDELAAAGAVAVSEDGKSLKSSLLMQDAFLNAKNFFPIFAHCEDIELVNNGVVGEGAAKRLGLKGISNASEAVMVARDILLAKSTEARLHLCHLSARESVELVETIGNELVTAEVCPHHFTMTEDEIENDGDYKMNPPLRSAADVAALKRGLKNGSIAVIATDHAPHSISEKQGGLNSSPFGIIGLETCLPLCIAELVDKSVLTPLQLVEKLSTNPAKIIGRDWGTLGEGKAAHITITNPMAGYIYDKNKSFSKARNTPFHGRELKGRVEYTIVSGKIVFEKGLT